MRYHSLGLVCLGEIYGAHSIVGDKQCWRLKMSGKNRQKVTERGCTKGRKRGSGAGAWTEILVACDRCERWDIKAVRTEERDSFNDVEYICVDCCVRGLQVEARQALSQSLAWKDGYKQLEIKYAALEAQFRELSKRLDESGSNTVSKRLVELEGSLVDDNKSEPGNGGEMMIVDSGTNGEVNGNESEEFHSTLSLVPLGQGGSQVDSGVRDSQDECISQSSCASISMFSSQRVCSSGDSTSGNGGGKDDSRKDASEWERGANRAGVEIIRGGSAGSNKWRECPGLTFFVGRTAYCLIFPPSQ